MEFDPQKRIIVVLGSTGKQGKGVVDSLLRDSTTWHVRAVTRNVNSLSAQKLLNDFQTIDKRLSLIYGDIFDLESLKHAFADAYGVFAVTSEQSSGMVENENDLKQELHGGKNIVDAAEACRVQHFVFSSLPNMRQATSGRFLKLFHMDNKYLIEQWAKQQLPAVTCLLPGLFLTNLDRPQYCRKEANGVIRFCTPVPRDKLVEWADPVHDMGVFAAKVFALGPAEMRNKNYIVSGPKLRMGDIATLFSKITDKPAIYDPISVTEYADLAAQEVGKGFKEDIRQMIEWISVAPDEKVCYGAFDPAEDSSWEDLHLKGSSFEDWLKRSGWNGPHFTPT